MTRGVLGRPPAPGTAPAGGTSARGSHLGQLPRAVAVAVAALVLMPVVAWAGAKLPEGALVTEVKIEGNSSLTEEKIRAKLLTKAGRPFDAHQVQVDTESLLNTKWFSNVQTYYEKSPDGKGVVLIFHVVEMPILKHVEFRGRSKISQKDIEKTTGLKVGARADNLRTQAAVKQIKTLYEEKGYELAEVRLIEGEKPGATRVVIQIFEGPKSKVGGVRFVGNTFVSDAVLKTKIRSKPSLLGLSLLGGKFDRDLLDEDQRKVIKYYQDQGFFEVQVRPVAGQGPSLADKQLTFIVFEGPQYRVRNITFEGNKRLKDAELRDGLVMHSGKPFSENLRETDSKTLEAKYFAQGCILTQIQPETKYTDQPGVVDLVYHIDESNEFYLGELIVRGNERTQDRVIRREADMAGLMPGERLDKNRMELFKRRLANLRYFNGSPDMGKKPINVKIVNVRPYNKPYGEAALPDLDRLNLTRMQDPGPQEPAAPEPAEAPPEPIPAGEPLAPAPGPAMPFGSGGMFNPPVDAPANPMPAPPALGPPGGPGPVIPPSNRSRTSPVGAGEPPRTEPSMPGENMTDIGPDRVEPFQNRSYADIITMVDEAPTGSFMFSVGATSYGGLNASVMLRESNFNLFNPPKSLNDFFTGQAFRGGGQSFLLTFMPGTQINVLQASFRDPYVFDLPIGFGASGYILRRQYPNWTEDRGGGRFSLGRQFGTQTYADVAFRAEDVSFFGYKTPAPADYLAASGHTQLFTIRPSLRFDNRNNPVSPTKGQYVEFAFEEAWGTFHFPKITVEGRQHFLLGSRPDGTGARFLTLRGFFGATGRDTPVYERFFAGDYRSMRGFAYRGVGPYQLGVNVGGIMAAIGSVEYQFPWTANDQFGQVVFCDFGTVEPNYNFNTFRAAVGMGIRLSIPQLGPMPLAFDLAFPLVKGPHDRTRHFTFFIGTFW
jgi:outer membrane protein insertion porin family